MTARYITKPPQTWITEYGDFLQNLPSCTVTTCDDEPVYTGLLDQDGRPIYRQPEIFPIGFKGRHE